MDPVFRSKADLWLVGMVVGIPVLVLEFMLEGAGIDDRGADLIAMGIVVVVLAFLVWLVFYHALHDNFAGCSRKIGAVFLDCAAAGNYQH